MADEQGSESPAAAPKPRAPRKKPLEDSVETTVAEKPTPRPRKPRKSAAQKAAELEEKAAKEATNKEPEVPEILNSKEPLVEESALEAEPEDEVEPQPEEQAYGGVDELKALFDEADEEPEPEPVVPPLSVRGVVLAPGYWQGFEGPYGRLNVFAWLGFVFAWLGFVFAFVLFPVGLIFSFIGLVNAKAVPSDSVGRVVAWIGLIASSLAAFFVLLWLLLLPLAALFGGPLRIFY